MDLNLCRRPKAEFSHKGHAILSASSSDRWLHCPPSARLCETYEDKGSDYAAEGTDAHVLCEYKLKKALGMDASDPTKNLTWYNEEMEDCATGYAAYILEMVEATKESCADPKVLIEQRVDFSRWVEQGFGTADCIIIADGTLRICDYKHGLGVLVDATDNPQMKCYALGALELFDLSRIVWRCISRLESTGLECHARTINELVLQDAVVKAINQMLGDKSNYQAQLQLNIATVIRASQATAIDSIDEKLMALQQELIQKANSKADYDEIADEIFRLRELRQKTTVDTAARDEQIKRINDLQDYISQQTTYLTEFDEALVRRWIKQITLWDDRITVELKSGISVDVDA